MKNRLSILLFLSIFSIQIFSQPPELENYGLRHINIDYQGEKVDILLQSKKGEANHQKPIFFFCQGSLPQPLIKYSEQGMYGVFPFSADILLEQFHLVIIGKPGIPLSSDVKTLGRNFMYLDQEGKVPQEYIDKNLLEYYLGRNLHILEFLSKQTWVNKDQIVAAGHSEGSRIAVRMAAKSESITHLIYSGGNPYGRIMSIISQKRKMETDSTHQAQSAFEYWEEVVKNSESMDAQMGDTPKATYQFSSSSIELFRKLTIPVLVSYGTKDDAAPYNDLLRVDMIREGKDNIDFQDYIGLEHNYFPLLSDGSIDYASFHWDDIAKDWKGWLEQR